MFSISENCGVPSENMRSIVNAIKQNRKVNKIILFGSRAKGNYKKGSDIDIAILADELSFDELNQIKVNVNEFMLPYNIDLIDFNKITDIALRDHILRVGKVIDA